MSQVRRRQILFSCAALLVFPLIHAQPLEHVRRIGVLMGFAEDDLASRLLLASFKERLAVLGWIDGRNLRIDVRWSAGDVDRASALAKELVALQPEVIFCNTTPVTTALHRETRTIPIVFVLASDPVGRGFVKTLAHPGGNITGFQHLESSLLEKWLQLLKEIAPQVTRVAVMFNPQTAPYTEEFLQPLKAAAPKFGVKMFMANVRSESDIDKAITTLGRGPGGGLIAITDSFNYVHRKSILALTARHKVPAIYWQSILSEEGGLISYGIDIADLFPRAAPYVDRILRGAKPADLPVELPTKFELVVNKKTAKALGITIPQSLLLRADRVID